MNSALDEAYAKLVRSAESDPEVLGFILCGSRGKGLVTPYSDYDCTMVVRDEAYEARAASNAVLPPGIDIGVHTLQSFKEHADWNGSERAYRYDWAHLRAQIDRTGGLIQRLIDEKGKVPDSERERFILRSSDHYINQVYRSIKCLRDGDNIGHRLEGADSILPLLHVVFALHDGRLRPYYKYLRWELTKFPLKRLPWSADQFLAMLLEILTTGSSSSQQTIFKWIDQTLRNEGFGEILNSWGDDLWVADYIP